MVTLAETYSAFFDIPIDHIAQAEIRYAPGFPRRDVLRNEIILPHISRLVLTDYIKDHEMRHQILHNTRSYVIRDDPELFRDYLREQQPTGKAAELIGGSIDDLALAGTVYFNALRPDLNESFADDGRQLDYTSAAIAGFTCLAAALSFYDLDFPISFHEARQPLTLSAGAIATLLIRESVAIREVPLTRESLAQYTPSERRYLAAIFPPRGISFDEHLCDLEDFGFRII